MGTKHVDCLICTIRPSLKFCKPSIFNASFTCKRGSRPKFRVSKLFQTLNFLFTLMLAVIVVKDLIKIHEELKPEHLFTFMELSINVCAIYCNLCYISCSKHKVQEYNGLLAIIGRKEFYGLKRLLDEGKCEKLKRKLTYFAAISCGLEVSVSAVMIVVNWGDSSKLLAFLASEVWTVALIPLLAFIIQNVGVYGILIHSCLAETATVLRTCEGFFVSERLERMQRLYMALRRNFCLNSKFFSPSVLVLYLVNTTVLIICQTYAVILYYRNRIEFDAHALQVFVKSLVVVGGQIFFCLVAENLNNLMRKPMSFFVKFPVSRLSNIEASKVEALTRLIIQQDMQMCISEFFILKSDLIATMVGTGITYTLVALQFRLFW